MSSRQSGLLSNVQDRRGVFNIGANSTDSDDVRLPYTQLPPDIHPSLAKYPPRHSERGVPPITSLAHGIHLNHDPEQARLPMPPNSSESPIQRRTLSKSKPEQARPDDGRTSKVRECFIQGFIDDDRDGCLTFSCSYGSYIIIPLSCVGLCSSSLS
jgi:hypothetical protein